MYITSQLTDDEKNVLEHLYGAQTGGYNPHKLEAIENLSVREKKFFAGNNFLSPYFFSHTLYKVRGSVSPIKFSVTVTRFFDDNKNLRVNFCNVGTRTIKVIRPVGTVKPEIIFRNLTDSRDIEEDFRKIFEADARRDINLASDPLIRFAVYKTGDEEFAVLVTMAQLIAQAFDAEKFFAQVTGIPAEFDITKIFDNLPTKNHRAIHDYWTKILDNAPPVAKLPYEQSSSGEYGRKNFRATIPAEILDKLNVRSKANRVMLTTILQTAWGFMLQLSNKRRDCLLCQVFSSNVDDKPAFNVIPVRMTCDDDSTVGQIVDEQFRQGIISKPYGLDDWTELSDLTGQRKLFNHFISFTEISPQGLNYAAQPAEPNGKFIFRASWDNRAVKLAVYIYCFKESLAVGFLYDEKTFSPNGIEQLCELYKFILDRMLDDWDAKYSEFMTRLENRIEMNQQPEEISDELKRKKIRNFLGQLPILQGRLEGTIDLFDGCAELFTLYEGDIMPDEMIDKNFIFVADGILSRNADTGDGWYNTLDIIEKNAFVNPTYLLDERPFKISATVLSDTAELLTLPHDTFIEILRRNVEVTFSVMNYALEQTGRYQSLWLLSSDYRQGKSMRNS
ncbi:MAG: hypothetical protein IJ774_03090 [Selenomonadaceae bacterium]|nr:hypothetical protein [Selenomonadaceae bacterium]